jgi:hypothetical protein
VSLATLLIDTAQSQASKYFQAAAPVSAIGLVESLTVDPFLQQEHVSMELGNQFVLVHSSDQEQALPPEGPSFREQLLQEYLHQAQPLSSDPARMWAPEGLSWPGSESIESVCECSAAKESLVEPDLLQRELSMG